MYMYIILSCEIPYYSWGEAKLMDYVKYAYAHLES